jgi:hypothetical protein
MKVVPFEFIYQHAKFGEFLAVGRSCFVFWTRSFGFKLENHLELEKKLTAQHSAQHQRATRCPDLAHCLTVWDVTSLQRRPAALVLTRCHYSANDAAFLSSHALRWSKDIFPSPPLTHFGHHSVLPRSCAAAVTDVGDCLRSAVLVHPVASSASTSCAPTANPRAEDHLGHRAEHCWSDMNGDFYPFPGNFSVNQIQVQTFKFNCISFEHWSVIKISLLGSSNAFCRMKL